jgi:hypothetical protein
MPITVNVVSANRDGPVSIAARRSAILFVFTVLVLHQTFAFVTPAGKALFVRLECALYVSMDFVPRPSSVNVFMDIREQVAT